MAQYDKVIVFGPTGAVGNAVANEAAKRGAHVWLAMRDTNKTVKGSEEYSSKFDRVQADLNDPASVREAINKSGAKSAFFYTTYNPNGMKDTIQAFKDAGLEHVVFLSSFTILPGVDPRSIEPKDLLAFIHGQVEILLEDAGLNNTCLRSALFASNLFDQKINRSGDPWKASIQTGEEKVDAVVPRDIGRVGGAVLVQKPASKKNIIYLASPEFNTDEERLHMIQDVLGQRVDIQKLSDDDMKQHYLSNGLPPMLANYLVVATHGWTQETMYPAEFYPEYVSNIKKYSGYEPTLFKEYLTEGLYKRE